jgi:NADPH:quinone reductase
VLITGAAGGVGNLAVQIAVRSGARVSAVVGSPERARILDGLGAAEIVSRIEDAQGRFALILESAGGTSLKTALEKIDHGGTVVIFGNSSGEPTLINFRDFADHQNARIQGFHYFTCEPAERFGPDLALLAALVADGSLKPRIAEYDWHELPRIGPLLRARQIPGKAVFTIPQT